MINELDNILFGVKYDKMVYFRNMFLWDKWFDEWNLILFLKEKLKIFVFDGRVIIKV